MVDERQFITEYFLRMYMARMFASNSDSDWCECRNHSRQNWLFEPNQSCFICNFSHPDVFHEASTSLRESNRGEFRLKNIRLLGNNIVAPERGFISRILGEGEKSGSTASHWRADFSLGASSFSAYYTVTSPEPNPRYSFIVTAANYVFDAGGKK
jgi:hypothetical protein